jgi:hypothetical protein
MRGFLVMCCIGTLIIVLSAAAMRSVPPPRQKPAVEHYVDQAGTSPAAGTPLTVPR